MFLQDDFSSLPLSCHLQFEFFTNIFSGNLYLHEPLLRVQLKTMKLKIFQQTPSYRPWHWIFFVIEHFSSDMRMKMNCEYLVILWEWQSVLALNARVNEIQIIFLPESITVYWMEVDHYHCTCTFIINIGDWIHPHWSAISADTVNLRSVYILIWTRM